MTKLAIPHDAVVFIGDGRKALFLRNAGDEKFLDLKTEQVFAEENPPTHEQGTDRPRRGVESGGRIAAAVSNRPTGIGSKSIGSSSAWRRHWKSGARHSVPALVIAAPPRTLADLRHAFHADVQKRIIAEIGKDLTKHPVSEIEAHLHG